MRTNCKSELCHHEDLSEVISDREHVCVWARGSQPLLRLHADLATFSLEALEQGCFFTANIGTGAGERIQVKINPGPANILAQQAGCIRFFESCFAGACEFLHKLL